MHSRSVGPIPHRIVLSSAGGMARRYRSREHLPSPPSSGPGAPPSTPVPCRRHHAVRSALDLDDFPDLRTVFDRMDVNTTGSVHKSECNIQQRRSDAANRTIGHTLQLHPKGGCHLDALPWLTLLAI